jgi:molecular chaperone DnaJ
VFNAAFSKDQEFEHKTYEEILEEYEKFFSFEQEGKKGESDDRVKGSNIIHDQTLTFAQSIEGLSQVISYKRVVMCGSCQGKKVKPLQDQSECSKCHGSGENKSIVGSVCPMCLGTGLESVICEPCKGDGLEMQKLSLMVKIPKSVEDGMLLRIRGKGDEALNGKPGDLIIRLNV